MQTANLSGFIPHQWPALDFEDWSAKLKSICGSFNPRPLHNGDRVRGGATVCDVAGLELAQVANDLDLIHRDPDDIRADSGDNLFLLLQLEGSCGIAQAGRQERLDPGDCVLVDSARPSTFYFGGLFSNHLSVHLPRQLLLSDKSSRMSVTRKIGSDDPMSVMLAALVAKMMKTDHNDARAPHLRELFFNATRQAFSCNTDEALFIQADSTMGRLEVVQVLIDEHLTEEWLSPQWLADRVGVSLRTLQDDLNAQGMTVTGMIKLRRLNLARARLQRLKGNEDNNTIAGIAYSVGFNDISYFNRCFRKLFDCSPKDVISRR
ncbi:helix-turn-helix domain-containing protein [Agrobacterium vitis]|uniref:helix-turn-helix domain-containing protein n=1 Tax=Agrobacterium vitis TaxID=373 RepID=UPI0008721A9C|nr:helix-turn-helix domain-containing protein [Agrobacterium vitis]MCE6078008.1 helix-turn-helix domain-containing protein [Agrobacterium vitis]MCM2451215.1 helix-turn-helix domain-containing protein [Agrobacterium vitis]MUO72786.1 helix-turn-helix domain-containing protein [Agrobacterium vitis]MUO86685.1 helix-turn-helix domain-containing protein [Agrobacterium vitis]